MEMPNIQSATEDIKDVSTEPASRVSQDSTKVGSEFAKYLQSLKLPLDNGTTGRVVEQHCSVQSGQKFYVCYPCSVSLYGEYMVQTHLRGKKHLSKLSSRETWPVSIHTNYNEENVSTNEDNLVATQSKSEVFKFDLSIVCNIQTHLDSFRSKAIIGLEYLLEILSNDDEAVQYNCILCAKNTSLDKILQYHLISPEHVLQYMSIHFNTVYMTIKADKLDHNPSIKRDIADRLSQAIENSYGRLRPVQCTKEQWKAHRTAICLMIEKREHFSERLGKTFAEILNSKAVPHINKDTTPGTPCTNNKAITVRTIGKREHFTDKLITTFVPIVAVKPLQDFTREVDIRTAIYDSKNTAEEQSEENVSTLDVAASREKKADNVSERSHSQYGCSPLREDKRTTSIISPEDRKKLFNKVKQYCERTQEELDTALKEMSFYEKVPEKHPQYPDEWVLFWNRRFMELRAENKDTTTHDFKSEWIEYWPKRLVHLHNARIDSTKRALRKELGFPENKSPTRDLLAQLPKAHDRSSPRGQTKAQQQILTRRSRSPRKLYASPRRRSRSPRRRSRSPRKLYTSPRRQSRSPRKLYMSPRRRSRSSRKRSRSPRRRSPLHRRRSQSPLQRIRSRSPRKHSRSPMYHSRSPMRQSPLLSSSRISQSVRKQSRSPKRFSRRSPLPITKREPRLPLKRRQTRSPYTGQAKSGDLAKGKNVNLISQFDIPSRDDSLIPKMQEDDCVMNSQSDINYSKRHPEELVNSHSKSLPANNSSLSRNSPHHSDCIEELQSPCGTEITPEFGTDAKCGQISEEVIDCDDNEVIDCDNDEVIDCDNDEVIDCDDSNSCSSVSTISTISISVCDSVLTTNRDCDGPRDIVPVLRLLAALEDYLGPSLGPGVLKVLAEALRMEKEKPNSSWNILQVDSDRTLLEMCKEKLRGKMEVGLLEDAVLSASLEAIVRTTALLQRADEWMKRRQREEENIQNRTNSVEKATLLKNLEEALLRRGKMDVTTEELAVLVDSVVNVDVMREEDKTKCGEDSQLSSKHTDTIESDTITVVDSVTTTTEVDSVMTNTEVDAYNSKNETNNGEMFSPTQKVDMGMDELSDDELGILMKSFGHLSQDERERLVAYINMLEVWNPRRMERLRQVMRFGIVQKTVSDVNTHEEESQNSEVCDASKQDSKSPDGINDLKQMKIDESESGTKGSNNTDLTQKRNDGSENIQQMQMEIENPKQENDNESDTTPSSQKKLATIKSYKKKEDDPQKSVYQMETKEQINIESLEETPKKSDNMSSHQANEQYIENCCLQGNETSHQKEQETQQNKEVEIKKSALISQQKEIPENTMNQCRKKKLGNHQMAADNNMSGVKKQNENTRQLRKISFEDYLLTKRQKSESTAVVLAQDKMLVPENSRLSQNKEEHENTNSPKEKGQKLENTHISLVKENHKRTHSPNTRFPEKKAKTEVSEEKEKKPEIKGNIGNKNFPKNEQSKNTNLPQNENKPNLNLLQEKKQKPVYKQLPRSKTQQPENAPSTQQKQIEPKNPLTSLNKKQEVRSFQGIEQNLGNTHPSRHNKASEKVRETQYEPKQPKNLAMAPQNKLETYNILLGKEQNPDSKPEKKKESNKELLRKQPEAKNKFLPREVYQRFGNTQQAQCEIKELKDYSLTRQQTITPENGEFFQHQNVEHKSKLLQHQHKNNKEKKMVLIQQDEKDEAEYVALPQQQNRKADKVFLPQQNKKEAENVTVPQQDKKKTKNPSLLQKTKRAENFAVPEKGKKNAENVFSAQQEKKEAWNVLQTQQKNEGAENDEMKKNEVKKLKSHELPQQKKKLGNLLLPQQTKTGGDTVVLLQQNEKGTKNVVLSEQKNKKAENDEMKKNEVKKFKSHELPQQKKKLGNLLLPQQTKKGGDTVVLLQQNEKGTKNVVLSEQKNKEAENCEIRKNEVKKFKSHELPQQKKKLGNLLLPQQTKKEGDTVVLLQQNEKGTKNVVMSEQKNKEAENDAMKKNEGKKIKSHELPQQKKKLGNLLLPQQTKKGGDTVVLLQQNGKGTKNVVLSEQKNKEVENDEMKKNEVKKLESHELPQQKKILDNLLLPQKTKKGGDTVVLLQQNEKGTKNVVLSEQKNKEAENVLSPQQKKRELENVVLSPQQEKAKPIDIVLSQQKQADNVVLPQQKKKELDNVAYLQQKNKDVENVVFPHQKKEQLYNLVLFQQEKNETKNVILPPQKKDSDDVVLLQQKHKDADNVLLPQQENEPDNFVSLQQKKEGAENVGLPQQKKEGANVLLPQHKNTEKINDQLPQHKNKEPENILSPQQTKKEAEKNVLPQQNKKEAENSLNKKENQTISIENNEKSKIVQTCQPEKIEAKIALSPHPTRQKAKTVLPKPEEGKFETLPSPASLERVESFQKSKHKQTLIEKSLSKASTKPSNVSRQIPVNKTQNTVTTPVSTNVQKVATSKMYDNVRFTGKRLLTNCFKTADSVSSAKKAKSNTKSLTTAAVWVRKRKAQNVATQNKFICGYNLHSQNDHPTFQRQNCEAQMPFQNCDQSCYQREVSQQINQFRNQFTQKQKSFSNRNRYTQNDFRGRNQYFQDERNLERREQFSEDFNERNFERREQFSEDFNERHFLLDRNCISTECDPEISQPKNFYRRPLLEPLMPKAFDGFVNRHQYHEDPQFLSMEGRNPEVHRRFPERIHVWDDGRYPNYP